MGAADEARVTMEAAVLANAMKSAAAIVETRNTIPILSNVRLEYRDGALEIVTTDLDVEYRQIVPVMNGPTGRFATTVDARRLSAVSSAADKGAQISLSIESGKLAVQSGRSRYSLWALPVDDFPLLPVAELCPPVQFEPASDLSRAIDRVVWAAAPLTDKAKTYAQGVYLNNEAGKVRLTALNGHCLSNVELSTSFPSGAIDVLLGAKFSRTLASICADQSGPVSLAWDDRKCRAEVGGVVLTGKLLDQTFPDYRRILPATGECSVIDVSSTLAALRRVQLISEMSRGIKIERQTARLVLSSHAPDAGEAREEVPAECPQEFVTGFNGRYLSDMLTAIGGETIEIHQADAGSPALFRRVVDDGSLGIVMPMRI